MAADRKIRINTDILSFIKDKVINVTDLTRTTKLTDILSSYADRVSTEVFVIQSSKNKNAQAVLSDLEYFQELLAYKEAVDEAIDEIMYQVALDRKDDVADISLAQVIQDNHLDIDRIFSLVEEVEEEE